jgi:hypothetical protein
MINLVRDWRAGKLELFAPSRKPGLPPGTPPSLPILISLSAALLSNAGAGWWCTQ